MPHKGFFSQGICILFSKPPSLDELAPLLTGFQVVKRMDAAKEPHMGGPGFVIAYRPEVNGQVAVDVCASKWPDHMGDPKSEAMLFGAWSMGFYGPFAFPGGLLRATQQSWAWPEGKHLIERHHAFVRLRSSYVFGTDENTKVLPSDYEALKELNFMIELVLAVLKHTGALGYFNPNGEVLLSEQLIRESIEYHRKNDIPPLNLWSNVRLLNPNNGWMIMDTVGTGQLDLPDLEACFPAKSPYLQEIDPFLRNCCLYLLKNGEVIKHRDTMNGPGGINWRAFHVEKELSPPPRRLIRWFPLDGSRAPDEMLAEVPKPPLSEKLGSWFGRKR